MQHNLSLRITGFIASLILTIASYFIIINPVFFNFDIKEAAVVIFMLALVQSFVQLIFFINVWKEKDALWNLGVFVSTISIIFIIVFFSVWIIDHLNYNMR